MQEFNFLLCKAEPNSDWASDGRVTEKVTQEEMMADFKDSGLDERFRRLLRTAKPVRWGFFHHLQTATYYRERIALLGDSAHASLPFQAAGAAQGIEDALILSNVLAELARDSARGERMSGPIGAGLKAYDSVRRPRAQKQLEQAYEVGKMIYFQDEEAGDDMEKILARLQNDRLNWLWFHDLDEDVQRAVDMMRADLNA